MRMKSYWEVPKHKNSEFHLCALDNKIELTFDDEKCTFITNGKKSFERKYTKDSFNRPKFISGLGELRDWQEDGSCYLGDIKLWRI